MGTFVKRTDIPLEGARTLPRSYFTDPAILAQEIEKIFEQNWLCVGREEQIARAGDYFVVTLGQESAIVTRDQAGTVRGFHNTCRHRGTRLCENHQGQFSETIQCPYHSWTYGLDGKLLGAPSTSDLADFNKADWPLLPVAADTWHGFIFINFGEHPKSLADQLGLLEHRVSMYNLPSLRSVRQHVYDVKANWKLIIENYSECYHCAPVHPALAKLSPPTSGENDFSEGPVLGGYMELNEGKDSLTFSGRACGLPVGQLPATEHDRVYYYSIFPNFLLSLHPDYVMFHTLWPEEAGRTRVTCDWLFNPETLTRPEFNPAEGIDFWDMTNRQDWHICEESQLGIQSRFYRPGPYSRREALPMQFDREVLRQLGHKRHY
ncbi:MAG: SRPBCC family protein [Gemmatimonadales bacterium]